MTDELEYLAPLRCPRCGRAADPVDPKCYLGCPDCRAAGALVNYVCEVPKERLAAGIDRGFLDTRPGLWRWTTALPVTGRHEVSMHEGGTPLVPLPNFAADVGLARVYAKNETVNPTWSHKDRLCALAVCAARAVGADTVVAASTGNHGASLAAYAGRAGMRCVIFTMSSVPETMQTLMLAYGAELVAVPDSDQRYALLSEGVEQRGWFPASSGVIPPVGSTAYGVDGYKTIAYELVCQLGGEIPDVVVLPVAYGDCLSGVRRGFADLHAVGRIGRVPKLVGAEVFHALERGVASASLGEAALGPVPITPTAAFSIGGPYTTRQAVQAVLDTEGRAVTVSEEHLLAEQRRLAATEGLFVEAASAATLAAARTLAAEGWIGVAETVVCLLTSAALKDPNAAAAALPEMTAVDLAHTTPARVLDQLDREHSRG